MKKVFVCVVLLLLLCGCGRFFQRKEAVLSEPKIEDESNPQQNLPLQQIEVSGTPDIRTGVWQEMCCADFWIALDSEAETLRMTPEEEQAYRILLSQQKDSGVVDWEQYPASFTKEQLREQILSNGAHPNPNFDTPLGTITPTMLQEIEDNLALNLLKEENPVRFGFAVCSTQMRIYPSSIALYSHPGEVELDRGVETRVKTWEPLAVLHCSGDGVWCYVQSGNSRGWVKQQQIAFCEPSRWKELRNTLETDFLIVTGAKVVLEGNPDNPEALVLEMGTKLPLQKEAAWFPTKTCCFAANLPARDEKGNLLLQPIRIPQTEKVHPGYLPYTDANVLRQAFQLLGHRYGWGGMFGGWDCSALVQDVYLTVGLFLPRNSKPQTNAPGAVTFSASDDAEREELLSRCRPGSIVGMEGHQTMFLGTFRGETFLLHATMGIYGKEGTYLPADAVIVTSARCLRGDGNSLLAGMIARNELILS